MCGAIASLLCKVRICAAFGASPCIRLWAALRPYRRIDGHYRVRPACPSSSTVRCSMKPRTSSTIFRFVIAQATLKRVWSASARSIVSLAIGPEIRVSVVAVLRVSAFTEDCESAMVEPCKALRPCPCKTVSTGSRISVFEGFRVSVFAGVSARPVSSNAAICSGVGCLTGFFMSANVLVFAITQQLWSAP